MSKPDPKVDSRRAESLFNELLERAQTWIPGWQPTGSERDFGHALLRIAARLSSEVTERLDRTPTKAALGLLDWLGISRQAGHAARMPIVFKMADGATEMVFSPARARIQANVGDTPIALETQQELQLVPAPIHQIVAVDPDEDAIYFPPLQILSSEALDTGPTEWTFKSFASIGSTKIQLSPPLGLTVGTVLSVNGLEYRIAGAADGDMVPIEPPLGIADRGSNVTGIDVQAGTTIKTVRHFAPFDGISRNRQAHELYFGDENVLNLTAPACIVLDGGAVLPEGVVWEYWGKLGEGDPGWQSLDRLGTNGSSLFLKKPKSGAIEIVPQGGKSSRWIRARQTVARTSSVSFDRLSISVNCIDAAAGFAECCQPPKNGVDMPKLEGVANTTALVLNDRFYPFGKIPRQFDSFFLACPEVFSKPAAKAKINFTMADPSLGPLAVVRMPNGGYRIFGVANDGALHSYVLSTAPEQRMSYLGPLRPSSLDVAGGMTSTTPIFERADPTMPPVVVVQGRAVSLVVWSGSTVWLYQQQLDDPAPAGTWAYLGTVGDGPATQQIVQIVLLGGATLIALTTDGSVYESDLSGEAWRLLTQDQLPAKKYSRLAPIQNVTTGSLGTSMADVFFAVDEDGGLARFVFENGLWSDPEFFSQGWAGDFTPLAILTADALLIAGKREKNAANAPDVLSGLQYPLPQASLAAIISATQGNPPPPIWVETEGAMLGAEFGCAIDYPQLEVLAEWNDFATLFLLVSLRPLNGSAPKLAWWTPMDADPQANSKLSNDRNPNATAGIFAQNPVVAGDVVIVPGASRDVLVAKFSPLQRTLIPFSESALRDGFDTAEQFMATDFIKLGSNPIALAGVATPLRNNRFLYFQQDHLQGNSGTVFPAPNVANRFEANRIRISGNLVEDQLQLSNPPGSLKKDSVLLLEYELASGSEYSVHKIKELKADVATVDGTLPSVDEQTTLHFHVYDTPDNGTVVFPETRVFTYRVRPALTIDPAAQPENLIRAEQPLYFLDTRAVPKQQLVKDIIGSTYPALVVLENAWETRPKLFENWYFSGFLTTIDSAQPGEWVRYTGDVSSNPELTWEYWNGSGWWKIDPIQDGTANLKQTGDIEFAVPQDLGPTDVLGRQSHWIRARLIGGDYGRETYNVKITPNTDGSQTQSVEVNVEDIRAPIVLHIEISYSICTPVLPQYLMTLDSGSWRDQSDANRTDGATVDSFVPISERLRQISGAIAVPTTVQNDFLPPGCCSQTSSTQGEKDSLVGQTANSDTGTESRALYLVFAKKLQGGPIRLLFLLEDQNHDSASPLIVEVLRNNRFEPVISEDGTRGLGESGVVTLSLDSSPTESELFGISGFWIRLRPKDVASANAWKPDVLAAYVNAVWASAEETQEVEILGSSDGSPSQRVFLTHTPVLKNSLQLRIRELLGDEELQLLALNPDAVQEHVNGLPGRWVLWKEVVDPGDAGPDERVYALDPVNGEIRFGDGVHGAIPPIGRDAIVAFAYRHGGAAAANLLPPFTQLSLVSPIAGVEAAFNPDRPAGGSDAEDVATVRRFAAAKLRHRDRAVTLRDLEDLALRFSADIAQARAFLKNGGTRLIVVIGTRDPNRSNTDRLNPEPSQALSRELRLYLLEHASPLLARPDALKVVKADRIEFRIELRLRVPSLDVTGSVAEAVKKTAERLFDPAAGGYDGLGWRVGATVTIDDVAARLLYLTGIDNIDSIRFIRDKDNSGPLEQLVVGADQLAWLQNDGVSIRFATSEVTA